MKIGGLASGMNTDEIIRDMMKAQSIPLDKLTQKKQYLEWQLNDYRSVNRDLKTMSDNLFSNLILGDEFAAKKMSVSNPDAVGIKSINPKSEISGSISVHQLATQATWQSAGKNMDVNAELGNFFGEDVRTINITAPGSDKPVVVEFKDGETIKSALEKINKTGVNAFYDSHTGQIAMTAKNSGIGNIKVTTGTLNTPGTPDTESPVAGNGQVGKNAMFNFNGLETERTSNTFQISGFEINLKQVTGTDAPVTFSSAPDTDKVMDTVVKFVDDYNKMIEELHKKIGEGKNRDFPPLSAAEKKDMTEKEIEQWEEKAMSGTLRNDPAIQKLLSGMRGALNESIPYTKDDGTVGKLFLSDIGITTATDWRDNGKLVINEEKLRQAITDDPNKVQELFGKSGKVGPDGKATNENAGLAIKLRAAVDQGVKLLSARAGNAGDVNDKFALGSSMKDMENRITRFQERLKLSEERLWKQFAAMEMSIQRSNNQAAQLMSTFGG